MKSPSPPIRIYLALSGYLGVSGYIVRTVMFWRGKGKLAGWHFRLILKCGQCFKRLQPCKDEGKQKISFCLFYLKTHFGVLPIFV